jgi:hypothetical protein
MLNVFNKQTVLYLGAGLMSLVMTLLVLSYNQPINLDGMIYLNSATAFLNGGIKSAAAIFNWPLYSCLIAFVSKLTHMSLLNSAYAVNFIADLLTVIFFIALVKELGGTYRVQVIAAFVVVFFPYLNHFRDSITRGHGYIAFALLSLLLLIRYFRNYQWRYAIGWGVAITIATLFRVEGACFVLYAPLILFFKPGEDGFTKKIQYVAKAYVVQLTIFLFCIFPILVFAYFYKINVLAHVGRTIDIVTQILSGLHRSWAAMNAKALLLHKYVFSPIDHEGNSLVFLAVGYLAEYVVLLINTLGLLYFILTLYAIIKKVIPSDWNAKAAWWTFVSLNIFITVLFLSQRFFLSRRYLLLLAFLLLATVPFALKQIYLNWKQHKKTLTGSRWLFPLVVICLLYMVVDAVGHFGPSKAYVVEAGKWAESHVPQSSTLCTSHAVFSYYANRNKTLLIDSSAANFAKESLDKCDYIVIQIDRHDIKGEKKVLKELKLEPIKTFQNRRGAKMLVFSVPVKAAS